MLTHTPVAVGIVALWAFGSCSFWARIWFTGPIGQIEEEVIGNPFRDPAAMVKAEQKWSEKITADDLDDSSD